MDLSSQLLHGLSILSENDRDLRTLTIFCNPNNIYHSVSKGGFPRNIVLKELESLEKRGIVTRKRKMIGTLMNNQKREYELWSLQAKI